jgi:poly(3-hydroxyalkanoate) synthetase
MFSNHFNMLMPKIIFKNKKYFKNNNRKTESRTAFNIKTKYNYSVSEKKKT